MTTTNSDNDRAIADQIVGAGGGRANYDFEKLKQRIVEALRNEREACAKVADRRHRGS